MLGDGFALAIEGGAPLAATFPGMPLQEALRLALQSIWSSKLARSSPLLGIIVSVAFLVVVVALIQGMNGYVRENITGALIGTNAFQVRRTPISVGLMDDDEVRAISKRPLDHGEGCGRGTSSHPGCPGGFTPVRLAHPGERGELPEPSSRERGGVRGHSAVSGGAGLPLPMGVSPGGPRCQRPQECRGAGLRRGRPAIR